MKRKSGPEMAATLKKAIAKAQEEKLPGFIVFLQSNKKANEAFHGRFDEIESALKDEDEILFDRSLKRFIGVCRQINQVIAEKYREVKKKPEEWELRYVKFMKIKFISFSSEMGDFYLVPGIPRLRPRAPHWFTVDEMIDIVGTPSIAKAIGAFGSLPVRPDSQKGPGPGEKHMHVDFTSGKMEVKYVMGKRR